MKYRTIVAEYPFRGLAEAGIDMSRIREVDESTFSLGQRVRNSKARTGTIIAVYAVADGQPELYAVTFDGVQGSHRSGKTYVGYLASNLAAVEGEDVA